MSVSGAPLVSILIRSMDRPSLPRALDAAAAQAWPDIEIIVVAACGSAHRPLPSHWNGRPLRLVLPTPDRRLPRPDAANLALESARGEWLNFLDDDDELLPDHLSVLLRQPRPHGERVVHARARIIDEAGNAAGEFLEATRPASLYFGNVTLTCATLFHRSLVDEGARFDPSFAVNEDYDFFVNLATRTRFAFVDRVTSLWHAAVGESGFGAGPNFNQALVDEHLQKIRGKWREHFAAWLADDDDVLFAAEQYLRQGHVDVARFCAELVARRRPGDARAAQLLEQTDGSRSAVASAPAGSRHGAAATPMPARHDTADVVRTARHDLARRDAGAARQRLLALRRDVRGADGNQVLGDACIVLNDFAGAVAAYREVLEWPAHARDAAFKSGFALGRLAHWDAAGAALTLACRYGDLRAETARGIGECARRLVAAGQHAPRYALPGPRMAGRISVIARSGRPERLARLRDNLAERLAGEDWELIDVADAPPGHALARGLIRASGELLVFCHDDVRVISPDFAAKLRAYLACHDVIGAAGTTRAAGPAWDWSGPPHVHAWISRARIDAGRVDTGPVTLLMGARGPTVPGAQLLDGAFLAARRPLVERLGFDESGFEHGRFVDLDFSYRAARAGAKTAVCLDIALFDGADDVERGRSNDAGRFCSRHPEACSMPQRAGGTAWLPMAASDAVLLDELAWLRHWTGRNDGELREQIRDAATRVEAGS